MINNSYLQLFTNAKTFFQKREFKPSIKNNVKCILAMLVFNNCLEWLEDISLVKDVFFKLKKIPLNHEIRLSATALYQKVFNKIDSLDQLIDVSFNENVIVLPKDLLAIQSKYFENELKNDENDLSENKEKVNTAKEIRLTGNVSPEALNDFVNYLANGVLDLAEDEKTLDLLLLAQKYQVNSLSMKCLEHLLKPECQTIPNFLNAIKDDYPIEKRNLLTLLNQAGESGISVSIHRQIPHIKIEDSTKAAKWECLNEMGQLFPITHLELTEKKKSDFTVDVSSI